MPAAGCRQRISRATGKVSAYPSIGAAVDRNEDEDPGKSGPKLAIVTGASRGIGRNTAMSLAKRGVDVIVTYHVNRAEADATVGTILALGRKAVTLCLDTGDASTFDDFSEQVGKALSETWQRDSFDYLVNNAGTTLIAPFAETKEADFDALFNIHFKGVFFLTQKLLPLIADGGRIVNISSGLTRFIFPGLSAYASVKGAVEVLTRYLAKELGPRGITVNTVAPGPTKTDIGGGANNDNPEQDNFIGSVTALGRMGVPDDIGPMIASLLSDENRWVTAQRIEVSGGTFL
jgi:NAD(P)-dependent dehydrogenase (short-subunit alcohol dehydrogenase family)